MTSSQMTNLKIPEESNEKTKFTIYEKEMKVARTKAMSFTGLRPPNQAWYIGSEKNERGDTYHYYKDKEGNYYYDSESQRLFEKHMQEQKEKRKTLQVLGKTRSQIH